MFPLLTWQKSHSELVQMLQQVLRLLLVLPREIEKDDLEYSGTDGDQAHSSGEMPGVCMAYSALYTAQSE